MKTKRWLGGLSAAALIAMFPYASADALNTQLLRPSTGHVQGFQLFTSEALPKNNFALGLTVNLAQHPFEQIIAGTTRHSAGLVDRFVTADALVSYGILDWWTINIDMPVNIYHDIAPTLIPTRDRGGGDAGDLGVNFKFSIFDAGKTASHLGLAVVPFITVPTGDEDIFFGDANVTGGAMLVGDAQWKSNRFYINVGYRAREDEVVSGLDVSDELLYGIGFQRPLVKPWDFNIIIEVFGATNFDDFLTENISTPIEALGILQKKWMNEGRLVTNFGGGVGLTNGYGTPDFRVLGSVAYAWDLTPEPKPEPLPEIIDVKGTIHFEFDKAVIKPESYGLLDGVAEIMQSHPEIRVLQIEGHTDSRGSDEYNQKLSDRRSKAIKTYLESKGVASSRLTTVGYGESQPIDTNETDEGRAHNRRSVFRIVERTDQ